MTGNETYSVIIPVYRNEEFIPSLLSEFSRIHDIVTERFGLVTEFVFVVDGSPDNCYPLLRQALPKSPFPSQLVLHTRNFGSLAAIRTGLQVGKGLYFGIIAADLQEPPELLLDFLVPLVTDVADVVVARRLGREDPAASRISANLFWRLYRLFVNPDIPPGGVDVFACNRQVRDELLRLEESNSSLVGLLYWVGFRRHETPYARRARAFGRSAWTFRKKLTYLLDSVFAFTDLPIRLLALCGIVGLILGIGYGLTVAILRLLDQLDQPGYAAIIVIITFFGSLNTLGLGIVGAYAWRANENAKRRPLSIVQATHAFPALEPSAPASAAALERPEIGGPSAN
jgi:glycosyltransferase involved in cell wall biosynthesis